MSEKRKRITGINPDLLVPEDPDKQPFYEGENFKIIGPLKTPIGAMGLLQAENAELVNQMHVKRAEVSKALNGNSLILMKFVTGSLKEPPEALVDLPPENFVPMDVMATDENAIAYQNETDFLKQSATKKLDLNLVDMDEGVNRYTDWKNRAGFFKPYLNWQHTNR